MSLLNLLRLNRSYRRFDASKPIPAEALRELVDLTRYCASGRNLQPLKYRIVHTPEECSKVFPHLKWAGYLTDWDGPDAAERPVAYLIQCLDTEITENPLCDDGLQIEALTLGAVEKGLGACIIKSFNVKEISSILNIPASLKPLYVIALGHPVEKVEIVDWNPERQEPFKYYRLPDGMHCVPKRPLDSLIIDTP